MQLWGRRFDSGQPVCLEIEGGRVVRAQVAAEAAPISREDAAAWPWIAPALIDLQVNGYRGQEFGSPVLTPEKVVEVARAFEPFGVVRLCPTLTTESFAVLEHALRAIASVCESSPAMAWRIPGIHVEGPYITSQDGPRGAHPMQHCRTPDWDEFQRLQEAAGGRIGS